MTQSRDRNGIKNPNWKGGKISRICHQCGKSFLVKQYVIKNGEGKFCSRSCNASSRRGNNHSRWKGGDFNLKCKICSKKFKFRRGDIHRRGLGKFCSIKCYGIWKAKNTKGKNNPSWMGGITPERAKFYKTEIWKSACKAVWKRDSGTCQRCNEKQIDKKESFHIHHIVSFKIKSLRAEINNLVLLCQLCHNFVHSKKNINREYLKNVSI